MMYRFFRFLFRVFFRLVFRWEIIGGDRVPKSGAVVLCCNHISNWDPPFLGAAAERKVSFMAKKELFAIPGLAWIIRKFGAFPVKRGASDKSALVQALQILEAGGVLGIFPEGTRSKTGTLGKAYPGAALIALKSNALVIPVAIIGPYRPFRPVKIVFGEPIDLEPFRAQKITTQVAAKATEKIMAEIRSLIDRYES
ncbi:lysophospholipid acyltransferase family protein [Bacillaceae bacterium]